MVNLEGSLQVNIDDNANRLRRKNGKFMKGIPDIEEDMAERFAEEMRDNIRESIENKGLNWTGELKRNVTVKNTKASAGGVSYEVTANSYTSGGYNYAAWHEFAEQGHEVVVSDFNNPIQRWARDKGIPSGAEITVSPINQTEGGFMAPAVRETVSKLRRAVRSGNNSLNNELKETFG